MRIKTALIVVLILGIIDAGYLTVVHFLPGVLVCPAFNKVISCETVLTSSLSSIFGIPVAVLGLLWFIAATLFVLLGHNRIIRNIWLIIGIGGVIYSIIGQGIISKICIFCVTLDILIILAVILFLNL